MNGQKGGGWKTEREKKERIEDRKEGRKEGEGGR